MKYRLICIVTKSAVEVEIDIEVCLDTGSRTLSPFQRKITVSELMRTTVHEKDALVQLLFRLGMEQQPFVLSFEQLGTPIVQSIISSQEWLYLRSGGKNKSLKRIASLVPYLPLSSLCHRYKQGSLIGGELYVQNLQNWWNHIRVVLRYENTSVTFPSCYSEIPFQDNSGTWLQRNKEEETSCLQILGTQLDESNSLLHLDDDSEKLKEILQKGWKLYVPKDTKSHSQVVFRKDKTGIEWFTSSADLEDSSTAEKVLKAYLQNRNYVENNGSIQLFTPKAITQQSPESLLKIFAGDLDIDKLYSQIQNLNEEDKSRIDNIVFQQVNATLKPYQLEGVYWLHQMRQRGTGCLLADDMGLGKTLQVLSFLTTVHKPGIKHLVICPASLTSNWEKEALRFTPQSLQSLDITSYELVRLHPELYKSAYDTLVIDEGQMVKNDQTKRHQAIYNLSRKHTIILSGTPIENSIKEIWSQFQLLIPESETIEKKLLSLDMQGDTQRWCELSKVFLSPFILRRTKDEVLKNLPSLIERNFYVELSTREREIYNLVLGTFRNAIATGISGRINSIALEGLLRLRQCCVSINLLPQHLSNTHFVKSTKMNFTLKLIRTLTDEHKVLVFSQFTSALEELRQYLTSESISSLYLSGSTRNRQSIVDEFQTDSLNKVFLISLKAGGIGLNLTAADRVIFLDDWWNPAVESQAFARAHRIGQTNSVEVYRIICKDTVEEKILELHKNKKDISDLFNREESKLTLEEIKNLLN